MANRFIYEKLICSCVLPHCIPINRKNCTFILVFSQKCSLSAFIKTLFSIIIILKKAFAYIGCFMNPESGEGKVSIGICSQNFDAGLRGRERPKESVIWTDCGTWKIGQRKEGTLALPSYILISEFLVFTVLLLHWKKTLHEKFVILMQYLLLAAATAREPLKNENFYWYHQRAWEGNGGIAEATSGRKALFIKLERPYECTTTGTMWCSEFYPGKLSDAAIIRVR